MTTLLRQAARDRGWRPLKYPKALILGLARFLGSRPLSSLALAVVFVLVVATGLFFWSGQRLRAADRACRSFHYPEAVRQLKLASPFRSWWDSDAQFLAARLARLQSNWDEAEQHLHECQRLDGGESSPRLQLEWVLLRSQKGEVYEVEPGLWNCINNNDPDSIFIFESLSATKLRALEFSHAATILDKWVALTPDCAMAWERRGWVLLRMEAVEQAIESYKKALEIEPTRVSSRLLLADLYIKQFKSEDARPLIEGLLAERPSDVAVLSAGGQYYLICGEPGKARQLFDQAYNLNPKDQEVVVRRAKVELQSGEFGEAEVWLQRARELEEANSEVHYLLHQVYKHLGRDKEAVEQLERYKRYKEQSERFGHLLHEIIPANPNNPQYIAEMGDILFRTNQPLQGVYWHLRALSIDPNYIPSHQALADYYELSGKLQQAAKHRAHLDNPASARTSRP